MTTRKTADGGDTRSVDDLFPEGPPPEADGEGSLSLVETDHIDRESVDRIERRIATEEPDVVAVELDKLRYDQRKHEDEKDSTENADDDSAEEDDEVDREDVLSGKTGYQFLGYWLASTVAERFADRAEVEPGADIDAAIEAADRAGAALALADRDVNDTAQRLWARLRYREKAIIGAALTAELGGPWKAGLGIGLFWGLLFGSIGSMLSGPFLLGGLAPEIGLPVLGALVGPLVATLDAVIAIVVTGLLFGVPLGGGLAVATKTFRTPSVPDEELVDADPVTVMVQEWCHDPDDATALIDERNAHLAHRLAELRDAGHDVLAVVGSGRRDEIERYVESPAERPPLAELLGPVETGRYRSAAYRAIGYACTIVFLGLFGLLALGGVQDAFLVRLFVAWFAVNFLAAGGVALLVGAHWTSAAAGGAVAWLTSVNPMITPGLFIAYVELRYTKVRVSDVFDIRAALADRSRSARTRLTALYREAGLFRLLTIMTLANLASFTASVLFVVLVLPYLAADVGGLGELGTELVDGMQAGARLLADLTGR